MQAAVLQIKKAIEKLTTCAMFFFHDLVTLFNVGAALMFWLGNSGLVGVVTLIHPPKMLTRQFVIWQLVHATIHPLLVRRRIVV